MLAQATSDQIAALVYIELGKRATLLLGNRVLAMLGTTSGELHSIGGGEQGKSEPYEQPSKKHFLCSLSISSNLHAVRVNHARAQRFLRGREKDPHYTFKNDMRVRFPFFLDCVRNHSINWAKSRKMPAFSQRHHRRTKDHTPPTKRT